MFSIALSLRALILPALLGAYIHALIVISDYEDTAVSYFFTSAINAEAESLLSYLSIIA